VVFDAADWRSPQEREEGGRVYHATVNRNGEVELAFANNAIETSRIRPGDLVWRTDDPDIEKLARVYTQATAPVRKQPVTFRVRAHEGQPLVLDMGLEADSAVRVRVESEETLPAATNRALTEDYLCAQLGRLGGTAYELSGVELDVAGSPLAPASLLNRMRREAAAKLTDLQSVGRVVKRPLLNHVERAIAPIGDGRAGLATGPAALHLLVRTAEQLTAAIALRSASITLDYLDLYGLKPSLERVRDAGIEPRVASPRILKPGEERIVDFLVRCDCAILVRPAGLLHALRNQSLTKLFGDFSLNAANSISARQLLDLGLERVTPTHDLNAAQISGLANAIGAHHIEAIAYQHLPVFHTEHCVFCRFLSSGTSYRDCGRPCEQHHVALRDENARPHPVMADVGCRNTVFGAEAQEASLHMPSWLDAGIRHFRLEFVHENAAELTRVARAFQRFFDGALTAEGLRSELRATAPAGITEGSLLIPQSANLLTVLQ
jgi:putative protease